MAGTTTIITITFRDMDPYEFSYGLEHLARFYKLPIPDSEECNDILNYYDKD